MLINLRSTRPSVGSTSIWVSLSVVVLGSSSTTVCWNLSTHQPKSKWKLFVLWALKRRNNKAACAILASECWTLPGRVGQSEAAPLEVDAAVHQQLSEEQRGVSRRPAWGILGRDLRGSPRGACFGPGHELNHGQPGRPNVLWPLLNFSLLFIRALRAQLTHGGQRMVRAQVLSPCVRPAFGNFGPRTSSSLLFQINFKRLFLDLTYGSSPFLWLSVLIFQVQVRLVPLVQSSLPYIWTKPGPGHDCSETLL